VIPDFDVIWEKPAIDGLGGVGHEAAALEPRLLQEVGQTATMVQVETEGEIMSPGNLMDNCILQLDIILQIHYTHKNTGTLHEK